MDSHGIFITEDDRILVVDRDGHQVLGFDKYGKHLFSLGDREHPKFQAPFNHPTDVAVGPTGEMYVSDGYGNCRVHRFSADGELIRSWGSWGNCPGEFTTPHGIGVLSDGRGGGGDRENSRVQVFDAEGEYLTEWRSFYKPMDIHVHRDVVYVADQIPRVTAVNGDGIGHWSLQADRSHAPWDPGRPGRQYVSRSIAARTRSPRMVPIP